MKHDLSEHQSIFDTKFYRCSLCGTTFHEKTNIEQMTASDCPGPSYTRFETGSNTRMSLQARTKWEMPDKWTIVGDALIDNWLKGRGEK